MSSHEDRFGIDHNLLAMEREHSVSGVLELIAPAAIGSVPDGGMCGAWYVTSPRGTTGIRADGTGRYTRVMYGPDETSVQLPQSRRVRLHHQLECSDQRPSVDDLGRMIRKVATVARLGLRSIGC